MRQFLRNLRKSKFAYERLIEINIYSTELLHNLHTFQSRYPDTRMAPVLKSNAYGHGLVETAKILEREDLPFLCVDSFFEAIILRNEKIRTPILILGYTPVANIIERSMRDVSFGIVGIDQLRELAAHVKKPTKIHLEIDTGMHRHGVMPAEVQEALTLITGNKKIKLEGIYTHLADADTPGSSLTTKQIERWNDASSYIRTMIPNISYFHCGGTTGNFYGKEIKANVMRLGIGLYGQNVGQEKLDLHPALEMISRITSLRVIESSERVGYNGTFEASETTRLAAIPVGYAEGLDRRLSGKGTIFVNGSSCPIVGRISMNITSIDVTKVPDVKLNDAATVISKNYQDDNSIENIAKKCETIPYDILVHIPRDLHRNVI